MISIYVTSIILTSVIPYGCLEPQLMKQDLYLAGLYPGSNVNSQIGSDVLPAVTMALRDVNQHPTILSRYQLNIIWNDTQVPIISNGVVDLR